MTRSITSMSYSISIAAALILATNAIGAPNEQAKNQAQQGNQTGSVIQNGTIPVTPPKPEDPVQEIQHSVKKEENTGGIPWGNFLLFPELSATVMYDDNIYASRKNEVSDAILTTTPEIRMKSNFDRHSLELGSGVDLNRYHRFTAENTNDPWVYGKGRLDLTQSTNVYGGVHLSRNHEDRSSPDALEVEQTSALANPVRYTDLSGNIGIYHDLTERLSVRLGASATKLNYENTSLVGGGTYSNDYRDRKESLVGGRVTYSASDAVKLFVQGANDHRQYRITDPLRNNRNSSGYNATLGMSYKPSDILSSEAYIGRIRQYYNDPLFNNVDATDYGLNVKYQTAPWTTFSLDLSRSLEETTVLNSSGYINTALTGKVNHNLSRDLSLNASLTRQWSKYNDIDRTDIYTGAGVGVKYYLSNAVYSAANYQYRKRSSTAMSQSPDYTAPVNYAEYDNNLIYVTLGTDFGTRVQPTTLTFTYPSWSLFAEPFSNTLTGFYAGGTLGVNSLNAATSGLRDPWTGNPLNYDNGKFAETGIISGLFAGYGQMLDKHLYFGAEAEFDHSNTELSHDHIGDTFFKVAQDNGFSLSVRPGYMLDNGSLFYGRMGWARTKFNNYIQAVDESGTSVDGTVYTVNQDKTMDGFRLGLGTDIPMGNNLFMRMDYAYTNYNTYTIPVFNDVGTLLRNDAADITGGTFKLGLGWNFGGSDTTDKTVSIDPNYLDGMYVGAMLGHGPLNSNIQALHSDGTVLNADFGRDGFTGGAFLGYGQTFGNWYLGAELEAEASTFGWHHDRQTSSATGGRDYYVHKKGGFGESVRLGYVLKNGSMIYGRVGRVETKFNSEYLKGSAGGNNWVDQDNTVLGSRVGLGAEIPFNKSLFMRMDYSYTNYGSYSFTTGSSSPDVVTYDNDESLFRFGLGYHF
ncbi:MAG: outer membrane beta-barrel protein [Sulfuricurvum sp.]|uniref:outer membrane beta-barrel protein n=1 Tax=Sulfuricurvum sp. TaxID=2025608 RepID=UPI00260B0990|nr:outer membrane beta-barrel protein [Sulfuricurvum sp.]MDD5118919.1 outer membrane beta-barrel protein [Sulfuricurvum sp.]